MQIYTRYWKVLKVTLGDTADDTLNPIPHSCIVLPYYSYRISTVSTRAWKGVSGVRAKKIETLAYPGSSIHLLF